MRLFLSILEVNRNLLDMNMNSIYVRLALITELIILVNCTFTSPEIDAKFHLPISIDSITSYITLNDERLGDLANIPDFKVYAIDTVIFNNEELFVVQFYETYSLGGLSLVYHPSTGDYIIPDFDDLLVALGLEKDSVVDSEQLYEFMLKHKITFDNDTSFLEFLDAVYDLNSEFEDTVRFYNYGLNYFEETKYFYLDLANETAGEELNTYAGNKQKVAIFFNNLSLEIEETKRLNPGYKEYFTEFANWSAVFTVVYVKTIQGETPGFFFRYYNSPLG